MQRWAARPPPTISSSMGPASARAVERTGNPRESFGKARALPGPGQRDAPAHAARPVALHVDADPPARLLGLRRVLLGLLDGLLDRVDQRPAVLLDLRRIVAVAHQLAGALGERLLRALEDLRDLLGHDQLADRPDLEGRRPADRSVLALLQAAADLDQVADLDLGLDALGAERALDRADRDAALDALGGALALELDRAGLRL